MIDILMNPKVLTRIIMVMMAVAGILYFMKGNSMGFGYWFSAAVLNFCADRGF